MAGVSAGDAWLDVHSRLAADFGSRLARQVQTPARRAGEEASRHFGRKFAAGLVVGGAAIGVGLWKATQRIRRGIAETTKVASDLTETVNKVNVVFGKSGKEIRDWSRGSARAMGLSRQEALANAASFGDMFLELKLGRPRAVGMSKSMIQLAADFASFHNADITQVLEAQQSAFRGEYDALQRFIPNINAARVQQEALRLSHKRSAKDLTDAEKAQAAYNLILRGGARAAGDYGRTAKELANQRRTERAQWLDLQAAIGKAFLPAQLAVTRVFTEKLLPAGIRFAKEVAPGVQATATAIATSLADAVPPAGDLAATASHLGDRLQELGPKVGPLIERLVDWFRDLGPSLSQVGPALQQAGGGGRIFASSLTIMGPVLDVVARNIHNLVPWLPTIVAGFLAFRAIRGVTQPLAQLGELISNLTAPFRIVALYGQKRALQAHTTALMENTAAMRGNAVSEQLSTAAKNGGILASVRARAATIAQAVAQRAVAAASKAWAAVQWLVNAALTANPIGLVIAAVALLVAGIIIAYKKSETFRRVVDGAFRAIAAAGKFMWEKVLKPVFRFLVGAWLTTAGAIVHGAATAFGWVPGIGPKLREAARKFDTFRDQVNEALGGIQDRQVTVSATLRTFRTPGGAIAMQHGGVLREPVVGFGTRTGTRYTLAERGPELVSPLGAGGGHAGSSAAALAAGRLAGLFRDVLRSWVVPWLRRIAVGIERDGGAGHAAGGRGGGGGRGPRSPAWVDYGTVSQAMWNRLLATGWKGDPTDRRERLYRPPGVYDQGGWLPPGMSLAVNSTGRPERVQGPGETMTVTLDGPSRRALVRDLADTLRAVPPEIFMDRQRVAAAVAGGAVSNRRR